MPTGEGGLGAAPAERSSQAALPETEDLGARDQGPDSPSTGALLSRRSAGPPLRGAPSQGALKAVLAAAVEAGAGELSWCAAVTEPQPGLVELTPGGTLRRLAAGEARPTLAAWAA
ncbi:hypothetical protein P8605_49515, partial [Streptomyces sp. T-3]|nr:hypothetical protein [Streptomyces sp. T-3]